MKIAVQLNPIDVLYFRDGRPLEPGSRASGGLPMPQTLYGAIVTHVMNEHGCNFHQWKAALSAFGGNWIQSLQKCGLPLWIADLRVRGPWLAKIANGVTELFLPPPSTLVCDVKKPNGVPGSERVQRLDPLCESEIPEGWHFQKPYSRPLWSRKQDVGGPIEAFVSLAGYQSYLNGGCPSKEDFHSAEELFSLTSRTGITVDAETQAAAEGQIYTVDMLELKPGIQFYAEVEFPDQALTSVFDDERIITFGGRRKQVSIKRCECVEWPINQTNNGRSVYVLISPGLFRNGWNPDLPKGANLVAASVVNNMAVSGWDMAAGGPKPTRFGVPAGSVFVYENDFQTETLSSLCEDELSARQGWGVCLKGTWNDA